LHATWCSLAGAGDLGRAVTLGCNLTPKSPTPAKSRARTAQTGVPRANSAPVRSGSGARSDGRSTQGSAKS
jgi:hypothetical protein